MKETDYELRNTSRVYDSTSEPHWKNVHLIKSSFDMHQAWDFHTHLCKYDGIVANLILLQIAHFTTENYFLFLFLNIYILESNLTTIWTS